MFRGAAFSGKMVWTTTFMACECIAFAFAFPFPPTFGSVLHVLTIVFAFLEFTNFFVMVVGSITLFITLHIVVNLWQRSRTNKTLVMISQGKLIMLFCLEEIINKIRVSLVILGTVLILQDPIRGKHSLKCLFNLIHFERFFLTKMQLCTYFMNNMVIFTNGFKILEY
jgi:hypothetical protein